MRSPPARAAAVIAAVALPPLALLAGPAQATTGTTGECSSLLASKAPVERPAQVGGQTVVVRDPYGGQVSRNRLFVTWGVRYPTPAARAAVASVQWLVDGAPPARNAGPAGQLSFPSTRLSVGQHVITAVLTPAAGGAPVTVDLPVTATDCQRVQIYPNLVNGRSVQSAEIQVSGGGPPLDAVTLRATGLRATIPSRLRGRRVGVLVLRSIDAAGAIDDALRRLTLRAPRSGGSRAVLLRRGGLTVVLRAGTRGTLLAVRGLPSGTPAVELDLTRGVLSVTRPCPVPTVTARITGGDGPAVTVSSGTDISRNC